MPLCLKAPGSMRDYCPVALRYAPRRSAARTVRFPNDVLFQDHIKQGDLEQVGRFIRARKVTLDTIYPSDWGITICSWLCLSHRHCSLFLSFFAQSALPEKESSCTPFLSRAQPSPASRRYLLSLGASLEATTDDGERPSDLIDPEYEDLVQLFGATAPICSWLCLSHRHCSLLYV
ncbi:PREDICTED: protein phosphatase 1 regulatory subunit 27 [Ficedula albicollis]|uniref:protein phosphatase 1 regulatory subunit 27 n=1 Tax=Ficedula albicollis TaxID=59894 RepID=UPI0007AD869A|nr:PREDICTED: protein phosphatase 1 regulatory subunit 27 [Ficedula albicollis]